MKLETAIKQELERLDQWISNACHLAH